jgi:hypothetical protein
VSETPHAASPTTRMIAKDDIPPQDQHLREIRQQRKESWANYIAQIESIENDDVLEIDLMDLPHVRTMGDAEREQHRYEHVAKTYCGRTLKVARRKLMLYLYWDPSAAREPTHLSNRTLNRLFEHGINTRGKFEALALESDGKLLSMGGIGEKLIREIRAVLKNGNWPFAD